MLDSPKVTHSGSGLLSAISHLSQLSAAEWKIRPARVVPPLRGQVLVIVLIQLGFLLRTVLVMAAYYGIDLDAATAAKMQYLKARSEVGR